MRKVVIFGGTVEGRKLAELFAGSDVSVCVSVATEYGKSLLPGSDNIEVRDWRLTCDQMEEFLGEYRPELCIDATHPYAQLVTENIKHACEVCLVPYLRIQRPKTEDGEEDVIQVSDIREAADFLKHTTGQVLVTTGSKELEAYTEIPDYTERLTIRVLPTLSVMEKCKSLGFTAGHIIGMQGPFTEEMNFAQMKQIHAKYLVTKNSGDAGGFAQKCEAAKKAGVSVIVVGRPASDAGDSLTFAEGMEYLRKKYALAVKRILYVIGMGPGDPNLLTGEAREALKECDALIGAKRATEIWTESDKPRFCSYRPEEIIDYIEKHPEYQKIALVYSGDIGFYSGAKKISEILKGREEEFRLRYISGLSSPLYFCNRLGIPWDEVSLVSLHGQKYPALTEIRQKKKVCALLGESQTLAGLCGSLVKYGLSHVRVTLGTRLSYEDECIESGRAEDFLHRETDPLSVVLFENSIPEDSILFSGREDEEFIRGSVPMTKEEMRVLALSKLQLTEHTILYDIGAGTGSISVAAALACPHVTVYAIERKEEGTDCILANKEKFAAENLHVVSGEAPECLEELPMPTHAFIGGSGGKLPEIIEALRKKNKAVRIVFTAITMETMAQLEEIKRIYPEYQDMELLTLQVSRQKKLGSYHILSPEHQILLGAMGGKNKLYVPCKI